MLLSLLSFLFSLQASIDNVDANTIHTSAARYTFQFRKSVRIIPSREGKILDINSKIPWKGYFSAKKFSEQDRDQKLLISIKENLQNSIILLPKKHTDVLRKLEIRNARHTSRGMANKEKIILHTRSIDNDDELISVFIHEMGHVVDLGLFNNKTGNPTEFQDGDSPIFENDKSVVFYRISWEDSSKIKTYVSRQDFVSGYGMSNPFEDFAETYEFYRLHGDKFRKATRSSSILRRKYLFMRELFNNKEFQLGSRAKNFKHGNTWDTTLLPLDRDNLVAID